MFNQLVTTLMSTALLKNLTFTLIALVSMLILLQLNKKVFRKVKEINPDDNSFEDIIPFLQNVGGLAIFLGLLFVLLRIWGVDVTPLLASAGVLGIAVAFAAQDSVANLFGGISIFIDKPFRVGDQILIEGSQKGRVYHIGARSTKLKTLGNVLVTIPNSVMVTNPIYNETGYDPKIRVYVELGVAYGSDLDEVEKTIMRVLGKNDLVIEYPEPLVLFTDFAESAISVLAIGTVENPSKLGIAKHQLIKEIYSALNEANIEIPFPQRAVHLRKDQ